MLKNITVMERTIFTRFMQLLGSKGGIVFEIIGDNLALHRAYIIRWEYGLLNYYNIQ